MPSKFAIAGHPIHPMLVAFPIGLFTWTLVADFVYLGTDRDPLWYDIAFWSGIAGVVGGIVAALPGLGDFFAVVWRSRARGTGITHMALNLAVVAIFLGAALVMRDRGASAGSELTAVLVMHLVGVGLLVWSGWLGAHMVYVHHIGMARDESAETEATLPRAA